MIYSSIKRVFFCIAESAVKGGQGGEEWGTRARSGRERYAGQRVLACDQVHKNSSLYQGLMYPYFAVYD